MSVLPKKLAKEIRRLMPFIQRLSDLHGHLF